MNKYYDLFDEQGNFVKRIHYFGYIQMLTKDRPEMLVKVKTY